MAQIWARSPYKGERLLLHLALGDYANDEGICWPSQRTLAHKARCSENFVRLTLRQMVKDGLLELNKSSNGRGNTAIYQLKPHPANGEPANPHSAKRETPFPDTPHTSLLNHQEPSMLEDQFNRFWEAYPRQVAKPAAKKAFMKIMKSKDAPDLEVLFQSILIYASTIKDLQFCAYPATWLNQHRWLDATIRKEVKIEIPQHIRDAQSLGAFHRNAGRTRQELDGAIEHLSLEAQKEAISTYERKHQ